MKSAKDTNTQNEETTETTEDNMEQHQKPGSEVKDVSVKMSRKDTDNLTRMERKVNGNALWDEGAEIRSPKRKGIRVESEETQDYVTESLSLSWEESEEISFRAKCAHHCTRTYVSVRQSLQ